MKGSILKWGCLLFMLAGIYVFGQGMRKTEAVEHLLPKCSLASLNSARNYSCEQFRNRKKKLLIHFWSTTCPSCLLELPQLLELTSRLHQDEFDVLYISLLDNKESVHKFLSRNKIDKEKYHFALDEDGSVAPLFGTFKIPETYLYSSDGILLKKFVGAQTWKIELIK